MPNNNVTNYDYEDLRKKIQDRLRSKPGWGDGYESTVGQNLIDLTADAADVLAYMLERRSQEGFQSTARLRSSVVSKASEVGYRARRAIASNGELELRLVDENGNSKPVEPGGLIIIEEGTPVSFDGENFFTVGEYEIQEGQSTTQVMVSEGVRETIQFDPNTNDDFIERNFFLIPDYEDIDENSIVITSDDVEYADVKELDALEGVGIGAISFSEDLGTDPSSAAYYDVRYAQDGMRIQFGDNIFGRQPSEIVEVSFFRTKGEKVRVLSINNEFRFDFDTFGDGVNVVPPNEYEYSLRNSTQILGGRAAETIDEIRNAAPLFITTNNRAVSLDSYGYWARRSNIGGIIDARAYAESELDTLLYNINNVYISYLTEEGNELSATQKQQLIDEIKERDVALAHIVVRPTDEIQLGLNVRLKRTANLQIFPSELYDLIRDFLLNYFKRQRGSIGREYQKSDLIRDFYDLETRVSGVTYKVTDFVDIEISAYQEAVYPDAVTDVITRLRVSGANLVAGDTYTLTIDSIDYTVTVEQADLDSGTPYINLLNKMRDKLYLETDLIPRVFAISDGTENEFVLEIKTRDNLGGFIISNANGTLAQYSILNFKLQIFPKRFNNEFEDILLKESIQIIDSNGVVLYFDNGEGFWVDAATGDIVSFDPSGGFGGGNGVEDVETSEMIDYISATITLPELPDGTYFVKYKQDDFDNFLANSAAAVTLIPPKAEYDDINETFTTIQLLPV